MIKNSFLVVDNQMINRSLVADCVANLGFDVKEAESVRQGLQICAEQMPDYILLDWDMEGVNCIEMLDKLRNVPGADKARIIVCTSTDNPSVIGHAYIKGANEYVVKPLSANKLTLMLRNANCVDAASDVA